MRIAFLCGSQEAGRDGVGDYTSGLAEELRQQGHEVIVIGLRDKFVSEVTSTERHVAGGSIRVLRLPSALPWAECIEQATQQLDRFDPEWVSLQFVCYTFHPKGLVHGLAGKLASLLTGRKLHIMFHELWRGAQRGARMKERAIGLAQKYSFISFIERVKPLKVHTSNVAYQRLLQECGVGADVLPLFGSIPILEKSSGWMNAELLRVGVTNLNRKSFCILGIFGNIPPEWVAEDFLANVTDAVGKGGQRLMLLTIGAHSADAERLLNSAAVQKPGLIQIGHFGIQTSERISEYLHELDFGVATGPWCLIGKSSASAAMLEHGLPVLVFRDDVDIGMTEPGTPRFIKMQGDWDAKMRETRKLTPRRDRPEIVRRFLRDLQAAEVGNPVGKPR